MQLFSGILIPVIPTLLYILLGIVLSWAVYVSERKEIRIQKIQALHIYRKVVNLMEDAVLSPMQIKKSIIDGLLDLIESVPDNDDTSSISKLISYLNGLLRIKVVTPPTTEIMSIIKNQKPALFHATRRSLSSTSHLQMLFQIAMDPALAAERLQKFSEKAPS